MRAVIERLRRDPGLALLLGALVLAACVYAPTLGRGLVNYDDTYMIRDNWILHHPSWSALHTIFFDLDSPKRFTLSPEYLPVRDLSVMLDCALWGDSYAGFHLTNLVVYLAAITLWFAALCRFGIDRRIVGLAMLIWAIHPSHAESVAWLAERKGLLAAMFAGATALGYARFRAGGSARWLALATLTAVAAVWSKAPAAFTIGALAGLELVLSANRLSWRRSLLGLAVIGVAAGAAFTPVLLLAKSSAVVGGDLHAPAGRLAMVLGVHGFYLRLGAMAMPNAVSYPIALAGPSPLDVGLGALGLVAMVGALALRHGRFVPPPALRVAIVLWLFGWLPISHLILPLQMIVVADRYLLLPSLGLALALAVGILRIANPRVRGALVAVLAITSLLRTLDAQASWRDAASLWERAVESSPDDGSAWNAYVEALVEAKQPALAEDALVRGLAHSHERRLIMREALLLLGRGDRTEGIDRMREAATAGEPRAMGNLALLLLEDKHAPEALDWARRGAAAMPMYLPVQRTLGRIALETKHPDEALSAFSRAYELDPKTLANRFNLALALIALHREAEARPHLEACLGDPGVGHQARQVLDGLATPASPEPAPGSGRGIVTP